MRKIICILLAAATMVSATAGAGRPTAAGAPRPFYYQIRIYHCKTLPQVAALNHFLESALVPALHRTGIASVGVFTPIDTDTAETRIYVLIPFPTLDRFLSLDAALQKDKVYLDSGAAYLTAAYDAAPYTRMESTLLKAFEDMPAPAKPDLSAPKPDRVYELRSYESPTEAYHVNKVHMFNQGGEVPLFQRLGFNAVFYADVLSGSHMPNLMYMTTFNSKADRDAHWKAFGDDPFWKKLVALPEYQHNVSKVDITFLHPLEYSDF
jgi:hypothetical protein